MMIFAPARFDAGHDLHHDPPLINPAVCRCRLLPSHTPRSFVRRQRVIRTVHDLSYDIQIRKRRLYHNDVCALNIGQTFPDGFLRFAGSMGVLRSPKLGTECCRLAERSVKTGCKLCAVRPSAWYFCSRSHPEPSRIAATLPSIISDGAITSAPAFTRDLPGHFLPKAAVSHHLKSHPHTHCHSVRGTILAQTHIRDHEAPASVS